MNKKATLILSNVFGIKEADIHPDLTTADVGSWDSLKQMDLVTSLENEYTCHCRRYTRIQMENHLRNAGLRIEHTTSFIFLLCPIMFLSRLRFNEPNK
jgi:hypothetical protein